MKTFAGLFVGGVVLLLGLKLFAALVLPMVAIFLGLIAVAIKVALVAAVAYFVFALIRNRRRAQEA